MAKIFLSTHGHMASGVKSSLDILLGNTEKITVFDAYLDETSVEDKVKEFLNSCSDEETKLLISDLYGGSVNQVLSRYSNQNNTYVITGVNLSMMMEFMCQDIDSLSEDEIEDIVVRSREFTKVVKLDCIHLENEDFF